MKERVYISVPVDVLTKEQAKQQQVEMAGLLDTEKQEADYHRVAYDAPEDEPLRLWWHLSASMLHLGKCDAVLFAPGWNCFGWICAVEFEAALRSGKRCLYTYRDSSRSLRLLDMPHCGGPEITGKE